MLSIWRGDTYLKVVLTAIAALLAAIALRPAAAPPAVLAQSDYSFLSIEPGTTIVRSPDGKVTAQGKVVVDRRTGDVWGFPTASSAPYPVSMTSHEPPVSKPIYLGRYDFQAMKRVQ